MFTVCRIEDAIRFVDNNAVTSVFLATDYDKNLLDWLYASWNQIDRDSSHRWHLLIPSTSPLAKDIQKPSREGFDSGLSDQIAGLYGLNRSDLPCLVFDDLDETSKQLFVRLKHHDQNDLRQFFEGAAQTFNKEAASLGRDLPARMWRKALIGEVYNREQLKAVSRGFLRFVPKIGSVARVAQGGM